MNTTEMAFIGYIAWYLFLLGWIAMLRGGLTASKQKAANSFRPDGSDVSEFSGRLCRAHANCYESFPYFGGILLFAMASDMMAITDSLALLMLAARIIQSSIHLHSTSIMAIQIRFVFFLGQFIIAIYWLVQLILNHY
jgi:uncharacterized MAPEG superfamily protein